MQTIMIVVAMLATMALAGGVMYLLVKRYFDNEQKERLLQMKIDERRETLKVVTPIRLQAYERMALFLERIDPNQLVLRIHAAGLTVSQEQNLLLMTIRSEFEHNLSQQIYISDAVWEKIIDAKTDIESIINTVAGDYEKDADSRVFAETLLSVAAEKPVVEMAIHILKADMQKWAY